MISQRLHGRLLVSSTLALTFAVSLPGGTAHAVSPAAAPPAAAAGHPHHTGRGAVVSATLVAQWDADRVRAHLAQAHIKADQVRHGVRAHRLVYRTIDITGRPTTASQLVVVPANGVRDLRVVSWLHGTTVFRGDVASMNERSTDRAAALLFAGAGHAVSAPDYLGLGEGPGFHPYGHPEGTVSAAVDALRATRTFVRQDGRDLERRVLISGFSQGGPATMMLGRALHRGADRYFRPGALAPVGGPFDLSGFEAAAADDRVVRSSLYLAYFATAWQRMYGLYDTPSEVFRAPYDTVVETLFDGHHRSSEVAAALPATSKELFTPEFLDRVRHPTGELRQQLRALDTTCDWRPDVPVRIFHSPDDADVAFTNARHCSGQLTANGVEHEVVRVPGDHNGSVRSALPQVVGVFGRAPH
ncbi:hypothetical protein [Streptomyces sp. NPDC059816]|uniref:hypothetical protein n=1 Tax=Streptomyces sp. NPDC059816 TaxID=3346960 RepID=UPI003656F16F